MREVPLRFLKIPPHPLASANLLPWFRLLLTYRKVRPRRLFMAAVITGIVSATMPLRLSARMVGRPHSPTKCSEVDPIIIIGHWRSGTTYLHNLLAQDKRLDYLSLADCIAFENPFWRNRCIPYLLPAFIPSTRPMDGVRIGLSEPQEDEWILATRSLLSCYHLFFFPSSAAQIRRRMFSPSARQLQLWSELYGDLFARLSAENRGPRWVLKNPAHTARLRFLMENFPKARFIHLYRNPYVLYASNIHLWKKLLPWWSLQSYDEEQIPGNILSMYRSLMTRYFEACPFVAPDRLIEIPFEDLETNPLRVLAEIYDRLKLPPFSRARPQVESYLHSLTGYAKNQYHFDKQTLENVYAHWYFTIDRWGYPAPAFE